MISISNLTKKFSKKIIFSNFNYKFNDTGLYIISGESGVGKTTLLNLITGIIEPDCGIIKYSKEIGNIHKNTSYIFQNLNLFDNLSVYENIVLVEKIRNEVLSEEYVDSILNKLGILKLKDEKVFNLSGGEKQRLSISLAIIFKSKVIIADEPTSSLDEKNMYTILSILKELSNDILVIISTHDKKVIDNYADEVINLDKMSDYEKKVDFVEQSDIKHSYFMTSFKTNLYILKKIVRKQKIRIVFSIIFLLLLISCLAFSLSISSISKATLSEKVIKAQNISGFIVKDSSTSTKPNDKMADYYNVSNMNMNINSLVGYNEKNPEEFIQSIILDPTLSDNEIILTDYSLNLLKESGVLNYNNIEEVKNKKLNYSGTMLTVKDYIKTKYEENSFIDIDKEFSYEYCHMSRTAYLDIFGDKNYEFAVINDNTVSFSTKPYNLLDDEIALNKYSINSLLGDGDPSSYLGKYYDFKFSYENMEFSKKLKLVQILDEQGFPTLQISNNLKFKLFSDFNGYINNYMYHSATYVTKWSSDRNLEKVLEQNYNNKNEVVYLHSLLVDNLSDNLDSLKKVINVFSIIMAVVTIIFVSFLIYNLNFINRKSFQILRLYGISKFSIFNITFLDLMFGFVVAAVLSLFTTYFCNLAYDKNIIDFLLVNVNIHTFNIISWIISLLFVFIIMTLGSLIPMIFKKRLVKSAYVRND